MDFGGEWIWSNKMSPKKNVKKSFVKSTFYFISVRIFLVLYYVILKLGDMKFNISFIYVRFWYKKTDMLYCLLIIRSHEEI